MTLPASGSLSLSQVNTELGRGSNTNINLNEGGVRSIAQLTTPGSTIRFSDLRGRSKESGATTILNHLWAQRGNYLRNYSSTAGYPGDAQFTDSCGQTGGSHGWSFSNSGLESHSNRSTAVFFDVGDGANITSSGAGPSSSLVQTFREGGVAVRLELVYSPAPNISTASMGFSASPGGYGAWGGVIIIPGSWALASAGAPLRSYHYASGGQYHYSYTLPADRVALVLCHRLAGDSVQPGNVPLPPNASIGTRVRWMANCSSTFDMELVINTSGGNLGTSWATHNGEGLPYFPGDHRLLELYRHNW